MSNLSPLTPTDVDEFLPPLPLCLYHSGRFFAQPSPCFSTPGSDFCRHWGIFRNYLLNIFSERFSEENTNREGEFVLFSLCDGLALASSPFTLLRSHLLQLIAGRDPWLCKREVLKCLLVVTACPHSQAVACVHTYACPLSQWLSKLLPDSSSSPDF